MPWIFAKFSKSALLFVVSLEHHVVFKPFKSPATRNCDPSDSENVLYSSVDMLCHGGEYLDAMLTDLWFDCSVTLVL